jgi:uncharacterized protein YjbJ (UPF0337 family)
MAGRADEMKGGLKEGLGKLTGDKGLKAEGATQKQSGRARRKAGGAAKEAKGSAKRAAGKVIDSPTLQAEGESDRLGGRAERA